MEYIILAFAIYSIILNCGAITMVRTLKVSQRAIKGQIATVTMADNPCSICEHWYCHTCEHCKSTEGMMFVMPDIMSNTIQGDTVIENQLLTDYISYRDIIMEFKSLPPGIEHVDGDTDNNAIENLNESVPVDFEMATSGLVAGQPYKIDNTLTWEENIRIWQERKPVEYPEGYEQGIVVFQDGKPIYKSYDVHGKTGIKKLIKVEKVKKVRKSKIKLECVK
jgi:hypothetical protein